MPQKSHYIKLDHNKDFIKDLLHVENIYLTIATAATTIFAAQSLQCYLNYHFNRQIVEDFLQDWDRNRSLTPHQFHHIFDALTNIMDINGDETVLKHANEIVDLMQSAIMRHFEKRYESALKIQAINNLSDTKSILDILKTATETAKHLGA